MQRTTPGVSDSADFAMDTPRTRQGCSLACSTKSRSSSQRSFDLKELSINYKFQLAADKSSLDAN